MNHRDKLTATKRLILSFKLIHVKFEKNIDLTGKYILCLSMFKTLA